MELTDIGFDGWVGTRHEGRLVGSVNVAWDGDAVAFVLDTVVSEPLGRHGIGTELVSLAAGEAKAAGCEWPHVAFERHLRPLLPALLFSRS